MSDQDQEVTTTEQEQTPALFGLLAQYESTTAIKEAAKKVRDAGYRTWDSYSPFPVHGIDPAMGIRPTILPWLVLAGGLTGGSGALLLQWWTNAYDYKWVISGKPFWSVAANIPITFELTVLLSALTAFFGMLMLNRLPRPHHPVDLKTRFARVTDDKFFILIESTDEKFNESETRELLESTGATVVEDVPEDTSSSAELPWGLIWTLTVIGAIALVPFIMFADARAAKSEHTQFHVVPNMDWQPKFKAQRPNDLFADGRAMRLDVAGTVAVGELRADDHFYRGKVGGDWARTFPPQIEISDETIARGKERFGIYCTPCHGQAGDGQGMVNIRATKLAEGTWLPPTNIAQAHLLAQPVGQLFNTITHGVRNMPAYGAQISEADRWATVLYVRALQRSKLASIEDVPVASRGSLK